ncbi:MAG: acyl-CoA dehydrogenase family protein [Actinomycetota bacterium]|nr:acyl-CoA dehydrogenase family protein [Actinomycetota bacterium]
MTDLFAPHHEELRHHVRSFVERELAPHAQEWERQEAFPREVFRRAGEVGLFGCKYPPELGGSGPDFIADAVVTEEIARCGSGGVAACLGAHKDLASLYVAKFGNEEQRARWLPPALAGEAIGALAVTEPDAGSDVAAIKTTARRNGDGWILNGTKIFITNGAWADFLVVAAKTDPDAGHKGLTLFVVDAASAGFSAGKIRMLGWRSGQTGELAFSDLEIPDSHRLGEEGSGFLAIMQNFAWERLVMALAQVAAAQRTYELAKTYSLERSAFNRPIGKFQVWRHRFAEMATRIEAGRAMTYNSLRLYAAGENPIREVAMAKLYTSELAFHVADECVQIHGGYGYITEFPAERALRDSRLGPIGGGTSEIMREIIGRTYGL